MRRIISALLLSVSTTWVAAQEARPIELLADAPERHVVVPGDTLWGIASQFLKDPYRWSELWRLNPEEIKNPHRIYPGQVVVLDRSGQSPQLKLGRVVKAEPRIYVEEGKREIPAIPQQAIEPFLSQPLVVETNQLDQSPRIVATQEGRIHVGANDLFYVNGIKSPAARRWQIYRPDKPLKDPETGETLGIEAVYLGSAQLVEEGEPSTLSVISSRQEIGRGNRLVEAQRPEIISYLPRSPEKMIKGRAMSIYGGVGEGGRHSIVTVSRGKKDGLEVGHVLAVYRAGAEVTNRFVDDKPEVTKLPDERYGLIFIFRVFDRVSYALVMDVSRPLSPGDVVRTP